MPTRSGQLFPVAVAFVATAILCGCRGREQPLTNPFAAADRVPAPGTRLLQPGAAVPYYPGDALPTASGQVVAPVQPFAQPAPAFSAPPAGAAPAFGQAQTFGQAPPAFGQAQSPVIQAQPFAPPSVAPSTFAPQQPFSAQQPFAQPRPQTLPGTVPGQPITPAPFNPGVAPQGSGLRGSSSRVNPASPAFTTAQVAPPVVFEGDGAGVAIPSDDQTLRPAVAQRLLPPVAQAPPAAASPRFSSPAALPSRPPFATPQPSNHVPVRLRPVASTAPTSRANPFVAGSVTQASTTTSSPEFSALPAANANLPWISGSAPRPAEPTPPPAFSQVVQAGGFATPPGGSPSPRVRLPGVSAGATSGSVQVTELAP